jgi:hypothetical protein
MLSGKPAPAASIQRTSAQIQDEAVLKTLAGNRDARLASLRKV